MRILITDGHVIDPLTGVDEVADLLIEEGRIREIGKGIKRSGPIQVIRAAGQVVAPGFIDLHTHLREPGYEYKETIDTAVQAAAAGGFTTICSMPNTKPVNDNKAVTEFILTAAEKIGSVHIRPIGAMTKMSGGEELAEIGELVASGCVAISDDGHPVMNSEVMRRAMEYATIFGIPVIDHCEDLSLARGGVMNEGRVSCELGLRGIPSQAEEVMVRRDIALSELTGARLHCAHISTAGSVRAIREAKGRGVRVSAETCPHYFILTEEAVRGFNTNAKMNPPLRTWADLEAIKEGLQDGTLDVIATDHAPHAQEEKEREFDEAPFGIIGLETALPLTLSLVREGVLTLRAAIAALTLNPARILTLSWSGLSPGSPADCVLFDCDEEWTVEPARLKSQSKNSPFLGWRMKGRVVMTLIGGVPVYERGAERGG